MKKDNNQEKELKEQIINILNGINNIGKLENIYILILNISKNS